MGLFTRGRNSGAAAELLEGWRGELNAELWGADPEHAAYNERAMELERALAEAVLERRVNDPFSTKEKVQLTQMLSYIVPDRVDLPLLGDAARSAYLLARAETWADFSGAEARALVESGCEAAVERLGPSVNEPRFRNGSALMSILDLYPDREPGNAEFFDLYDYVVSRSSHGRLAGLQRERAALDRSAFGLGRLAADDVDSFELHHARAWNVGLCVWLFNEPALL